MQRTLGVALLMGLLVACGDAIAVEGEGGVTLRYRCGAAEATAASEEEVRLVRQSAGRAIRYEGETRGGVRARALEAALRRGDDEALEMALIEYACAHGDAALRLPRFPEPGSEAPAFRLATLDGEAISSLADLRGRVVVLNFWATWCVPCLREYPELVEVAQEFADAGVVVLGILTRDTPAAAQRWMSDHDGGFATLLDPRGEVAGAYRVRGLPQTYVIGRDGRILASVFGHSDGQPRAMVVAALELDRR